MEVYNFNDKVYLEKCNNAKEAFSFIDKILDNYELPKNKNAKIVLKPNLNNDMNALIGNSTDLRVIIIILYFPEIISFFVLFEIAIISISESSVCSPLA